MDEAPTQLRSLPVQLIEIEGGVVLKRGRIEFQVLGEGAVELIRTVITATSGEGATVEEIGQLFAAPDRPQVEELIRNLRQRRLLVPVGETDDLPESQLDVFYWHFGVTAAGVMDRLQGLRIAVLGVNAISRRLNASLASSGFRQVVVVDEPVLRNLRFFTPDGRIVESEWGAHLVPPTPFATWSEATVPSDLDCLVATSDFGGCQLLRRWNRFCVENGCHFFPVVLQDLVGGIGPLVVPGETACYECLWARQNAHFAPPAARRVAESVAFEGQAVVGFHPALASVLGDLAAMEMTKFYGLRMPISRVGQWIEVNLLAPGIEARSVLKVPRCPVCSPLVERRSTALVKEFTAPS